MRQVSAKRRKRDKNYPAARRAVFARSMGACEAEATIRCNGQCQQVHHLAGRGGPDPHRLDGLLGVCAPCHEHIHRNVAEAYEHGWMVSRLGKDAV